MHLANSESVHSLKSSTGDAITCAEVDETISMALRAAVQECNRISGTASSAGVAEAFADGWAAPEASTSSLESNPFVGELTEWVHAGLVTAEGCAITRDEFRRRLEALKARYAGRAVELHVCEAAEKLDALVCNRP